MIGNNNKIEEWMRNLNYYPQQQSSPSPLKPPLKSPLSNNNDSIISTNKNIIRNKMKNKGGKSLNNSGQTSGCCIGVVESEFVNSGESSSSCGGNELSMISNSDTKWHPIACYSCRNSHKKCDKLLPSCTKCIDKGVPCLYENPRKRGKGSLAYPHKKKKMNQENDKQEMNGAYISTLLPQTQSFSLRIPNLIELYFTFICAGHPFIKKNKLEYFINNFLFYFENDVDIDQIHLVPNDFIISKNELKCIHVFYLSILVLGHQMLANIEIADKVARMCELEIAKLSLENYLNFYWACSTYQLSLYYTGSGILQKARYYVTFADFYCGEFPEMTDPLQKNLVKRKVFSVGFSGESINEFGVFIGNMPNVFKTTSNQKLEDILLPGTMEYLKTAKVTRQNFLLFRQVIDFSFAVTTQYRTEVIKNMTDCHSPLFFSGQMVLRMMVMNGFKLLFLLKALDFAKDLAEEVALRITLLAEHDVFIYANADVSIAMKTASKFHLDICKEIEEGKRQNNTTLQTSTNKVLNVDYFSILEKDIKSLKFHSKKFIRVRNECIGMLQEMEEMLERHRQRRTLAIILDNHNYTINQSEQFPVQQDPFLSSLLTYLNEINQNMPKKTYLEDIDSEWKDLFNDSIL